MFQRVLWFTCFIAMIALNPSRANAQIVQFDFSGEIEFADISNESDSFLPIPEFGPGDSFSASYTVDFNRYLPFFADAAFQAGAYNATSFSEVLGPFNSFVALIDGSEGDSLSLIHI